MRPALVDVRSPSVFPGCIMSDVDIEAKPGRDATWFVDTHPARRNQLYWHLGCSVQRQVIGVVIEEPFISVVQAHFQSKRDAIHREYTAAANTSLIHFAHQNRRRPLDAKRVF